MATSTTFEKWNFALIEEFYRHLHACRSKKDRSLSVRRSVEWSPTDETPTLWFSAVRGYFSTAVLDDLGNNDLLAKFLNDNGIEFTFLFDDLDKNKTVGIGFKFTR